MKKTSKFVQLIMTFIVLALCVGCVANPSKAVNVEESSFSNDTVLEDPDYVSNSAIEWFNFLEDTETLDKKYDQLRYSAIVNAGNGVVKKYSIYRSGVKKEKAYYNGAKKVVYYDYPQLEFLEYDLKSNWETNSYTLEVTNQEEYNQKIEQIDEVIQNLVKEVNKETSLVSKYRKINDWIVENVEYDLDFLDLSEKPSDAQTDEELEYMQNTNASNIYGAIVEKKAVCLGIAKAFKYICNKCNLECMVIIGNVMVDGESAGHAWNVVPIYGTYFLIDCTWELESYVKYGVYKVVDEDTGIVTLETTGKYDYFLLEDLWESGRTFEEKIDQFFRNEDQKWTFDGNVATNDNGITIELPEDYEFISTVDSYQVFQLTSEGYDKLFSGEETDEVSLKTNAKIEYIMSINDYKGRRLMSVQEFVNEERLGSDDISTCCIVIVRYNGELYPIKIRYSYM